MTNQFTFEDTAAQLPKIKVIGVGGGGGNALNNMIRKKRHPVAFVAVDTDALAITQNLAETKLHLSVEDYQGKGAGGSPVTGRDAAMLNRKQIQELITDTDMVMIMAGMGGGTGTGAAPVIAEIAMSLGILTIAVIIKPLSCEGDLRMLVAEAGVDELKKFSDSVISIPNQDSFFTSMPEAFQKAEDLVLQAVRGISVLTTGNNYMNVKIADVKDVLSESGDVVLVGSGFAKGANRGFKASELAISSSLLNDVDIHGAQGILINVTGSDDMTLGEYGEAVSIIHNMADENANIISGIVYDQSVGDSMRVTVVASGSV